MPSSITSSSVLIHCKGILFDMDGILISSVASVERSWSKWANMRGVDPAYACQVIHGRRSIDSIALLRPDLDAEAENRIIESIELEDNDGVTILPGVLKLIAALPKSNWTVVTSATEPIARTRLGWSQHFYTQNDLGAPGPSHLGTGDCTHAGWTNSENALSVIPMPERIVTSESVTQGKPDPAPYLAGAALLGFAPQECVVFEDSASGAKSARAAGCTVIATTFSHSIAALTEAHYIVPDLTAIQVDPASSANDLILKLTPIQI